MPYPVAAVRGKNFGLEAYKAKVLSIDSSNLVGYWPLDEATGSTADNAEGTAARDGTYSNVTLGQTGIGDGGTSASFNGTTSYVNIYSASLNTALTPNEMTMMAWVKVSGAGVWTDNTLRWFFQFRADANNRAILLKTNTTNQLQWFLMSGGVNKAVLDTSLAGDTGWFHMLWTITDTGDALKAYLNGSQVGSTQTGIGTFVGVLGADTCSIGAQGASATSVWSGYIAHAAAWNGVLGQSDITRLATV